MRAKYPELYKILELLDKIASGYNKVWDQKYEEALNDFGMIDLLPMKSSDQPV